MAWYTMVAYDLVMYDVLCIIYMAMFAMLVLCVASYGVLVYYVCLGMPYCVAE